MIHPLQASRDLLVPVLVGSILAVAVMLLSRTPEDAVVGETLDDGADLSLASTDPYRTQATSDPRVVCLPGDPNAPRVEFVFVTSDAGVPLPRQEMLETAAWVDRVFADSASHHSPGSFRAVRWHQEEVGGGRCEPVLRKVVVDDNRLDQWSRSNGSWNRYRDAINEAVGADSASGPRRYLVWADMQHPGYCGHGEMPRDSRPDPDVNLANGPHPRLAVVYDGCHGRVSSTEVHELVHTFGAVLPIAPNASSSHCSDHHDRLCVGTPRSVVCDGIHWLLDCGGDDYYNPGATLVGRNGRPFWNVADSVFLIDRRPDWWPTGSDKSDNPPKSDPVAASDPTERFSDTGGHVFSDEVAALADLGVTRGCNPPTNTRFCPDQQVTRGQMAAFLNRALDLGGADRAFDDTADHIFGPDISALATAGITRGCGNGAFCPDRPVTRGQMAAFLNRALDLAPSDQAFTDTEGHIFGPDAAALAAAGITRGCDPPSNTRFCPDAPVTRGQMAAFLTRAGLSG